MSGRYDDIIHLPHHVSPTRRRMSVSDRAAQFSPFAALTGYEAAIAETERLTDSQVDFDVDGREMLDGKLRCLADRLPDRPEVTVTYFRPDERKAGGAYRRVSGVVKKIDTLEKALLMEDGTAVFFDRIYDISFGGMEDSP